ncbi:MAG TPA: condensation domain-containing protein, partial [Kofleriaceae bacterium]
GDEPARVVYLASEHAADLTALVALGESRADGAAPELLVVGKGFESPSGDEALDPEAALLFGVRGCYPGRVRFIDTGAVTGAMVGRRAEQLCGELSRDDARVAYRGKQRWTVATESAPASTLVPAAGSYLLWGDLTGPSWWFARAWAAQRGSKLLVVGEVDAARARQLEEAGAELVRLDRAGVAAALRGQRLEGAVITLASAAPASAAACAEHVAQQLELVGVVGELLAELSVGFCLVQSAEPAGAAGLERVLGEALAATAERAVRTQETQSDHAWLAIHFQGLCDGEIALVDAGTLPLGAAELRTCYARALALEAAGSVRIAAAAPAPETQPDNNTSQATRPEGLPPYVAPRTPTEQKLATVWSQYLGFSQIGVDDNFFDLGGHSLLATQVAARLREVLSLELPLKQFFENATISLLSACLERAPVATSSASLPIPRVSRERPLPLSFPQQRMWFFEQLEPGSSTYTVPGCIRLRLALDVGALQRAMNEILRRHEALRTTFHELDGRPVQVIAPHLALDIPLHDLSGLPEAVREDRVIELATRETRRPFDLTTGPLVRATLMKCGAEDFVLQIAMHHIVSDGWSLGVFIRELSALYAAFSANEASPFEDLPIQYADFA